jgi:hypothetical protein
MPAGYRPFYSLQNATGTGAGLSADVGVSSEPVSMQLVISGAATVIVEASADDANWTVFSGPYTASSIVNLNQNIPYYRATVLVYSSGYVSAIVGLGRKPDGMMVNIGPDTFSGIEVPQPTIIVTPSSTDFLFLKRDFGAQGDYPVTDDTAAIQAWLDAGAAGDFYQYPVLVAEPGAYKFTAPLTYIPTTGQPTLNILGAGSYDTAFVASGSAFGPSAPLFQVGDATHLVQMNVRGLVLNGNGTNYSTGTVTTVNGSTTVEGVGTAFAAAMVDKMIVIDSNGLYRIDSVTDPTHLELTVAFQQTGAAGLSYFIPMGQNAVTGATVGWDIYDKGSSRYDDMGAWYCDTGLKWEAVDGSVNLYSCSFYNNNIAVDGRLTVPGLFPEALTFFGGDYGFSFDVFRFDGTTIGVNLNWYGTSHAVPSFGGNVWFLKAVQAFTIDGCNTDVGASFQSGRIITLQSCSGGSVKNSFFAKGGSAQVVGFVDLVDTTDVIIEGNFFRAGGATDNAIHLSASTARNRIGPNAGLLTTFTTPVVDDSTATGDDVNVYIAQAPA